MMHRLEVKIDMLAQATSRSLDTSSGHFPRRLRTSGVPQDSSEIVVTSSSGSSRITVSVDLSSSGVFDVGDIISATIVRHEPQHSEAYLTMLASEAVLSREWDRPEEDEAWASL